MPVSAQVEEADEVALEAEAAAAAEADKWTTPKRNQVFFRGAYTRLTNNRGGLVLLGEIFVEYSRFSKKVVAQTTSALLGGTATSDVHVSELNVTIAPMLRYDGWKVVRPFFIPIGLAFLVNSPPSNDTTYLDVGLHWALGFDFALSDLISLGVDVRYTYAFDQTNTNNSYLSTGGYAAVNF